MRQPSITIVGAGLGGIGTAVALQEAGFTDVTLLEKSDRIGGVWRDNTYPGAACDVPSALYSWSFAPNRDWHHRYARQPEILAYVERTAREHGVVDRVVTRTEVISASWEETSRRWHLETSAGSRTTEVLITCVGQLSLPAVPTLPGIDDFTGPAFHSAEWDHTVDLTGKRVAVVGTGASAIQFVPAIAPVVGGMTIFQRTAPWVIGKPDSSFGAARRRLHRRMPWVQDAERAFVWRLSERFNLTFTRRTLLRRVAVALSRRHLRSQVRDPELRRLLTPRFELGCRRLLFSNDWYPALGQPHVELVDSEVTEVLPHGVRSADGRVHAADAIVYGTGFAATEFLAPMEITGIGGASLQRRWQAGARAYLGLCVPDFPNLFLVYGPNTNLGGSSIIAMLEAASAGVVRLLKHTVRAGAEAVVVRREAEQRYDEEIQGRLDGSVWSTCRSYYREADGRISTNWPGQVQEYVDRCTHLDPADFAVL